MNTPEDNAHDFHFPLAPKLLSEVAKVTELVSACAGMGKGIDKAMLIGRVVEGLEVEDWRDIASRNGLCSWLGIPLTATSAASVDALMDIMDKLAFQRDHDSLTGLANRRYFDRHFRLELDRAQRTGGSVSLVMLDFDDFKLINDRYGHQCGDMLLAKFGTFLKKSQRAYDLAARVGGEEFALIVPGTSCWKAKKMAERLLAQFARTEFKCKGFPPFCMTFSGGVACADLESGYPSAEELFQQADKALYTAKRNGKKRVCVDDDGRPTPADTIVQSEEKRFLFSHRE